MINSWGNKGDEDEHSWIKEKQLLEGFWGYNIWSFKETIRLRYLNGNLVGPIRTDYVYVHNSSNLSKVEAMHVKSARNMDLNGTDKGPSNHRPSNQ